jgi:hypothetical protein
MTINSKQLKVLEIMNKTHITKIYNQDSKGNLYTNNYNSNSKYYYEYIITIRGTCALVTTHKATIDKNKEFKNMISISTHKVSIKAQGSVSN